MKTANLQLFQQKLLVIFFLIRFESQLDSGLNVAFCEDKNMVINLFLFSEFLILWICLKAYYLPEKYLAMETTELLIQIKNEIDDLKKLIRQTSFGPAVSDKWLPRAKVMEFLNYGSTQMAEFEKNGGVEVAKIGKRKFINRDSLTKLLNNNTVRSEVFQSNSSSKL